MSSPSGTTTTTIVPCLALLLLAVVDKSHAFMPPAFYYCSSQTKPSVPPFWSSSTITRLHETVVQSDENILGDKIDVDFPSKVLYPGEILPMAWDGQILSKNAFRLGLPPQLVTDLRSYADDMGITDFYRNLVVGGKPYYPGQQGTVAFSRNDDEQTSTTWLVQRPKSHWRSNMHWTSPANEEAHDDYLRVLSAGGFDGVLEKIGTYFGLEHLSAYHLSFIGVSHCEKGYIHADVNESGRKAFNIIIPLLLYSSADDHDNPELEILSDDETATRFYKYKINAASMVGDDALHATASCDYRGASTMRLAATVYVGEITTENVNQLLMSLTQDYPPPGDAKHLLDRAGSHWSKWDATKKLPF